MSAVRHPNVVRFWGVCAVVGYCHIVMELCDQSLMDLLQTPGHDVWNDQFRALFMSRVANQVRRREEKGGEGRRREEKGGDGRRRACCAVVVFGVML